MRMYQKISVLRKNAIYRSQSCHNYLNSSHTPGSILGQHEQGVDQEREKPGILLLSSSFMNSFLLKTSSKLTFVSDVLPLTGNKWLFTNPIVLCPNSCFGFLNAKPFYFKYLLTCQCLPVHCECWTIHVLFISISLALSRVPNTWQVLNQRWMDLWKNEWLIESCTATLFHL